MYEFYKPSKIRMSTDSTREEIEIVRNMYPSTEIIKECIICGKEFDVLNFIEDTKGICKECSIGGSLNE